MGVSPKWVKSKRRREKKKEREKDWTMVITMAKLRMVHASTHGARKPPGPKQAKHRQALAYVKKQGGRKKEGDKEEGEACFWLYHLWGLRADAITKLITENMMLTFMICHIIGVSSACTNPILYGFLNDNFVKEFNLLCPVLAKLAVYRHSSRHSRDGKVDATEQTTLLPTSAMSLPLTPSLPSLPSSPSTHTLGTPHKHAG